MEDTLLLFSKTSGLKDRLFRLASLSKWSSLDLLLPRVNGAPPFVIGLGPETGVVTEMPLANRIVQADTVGLMTLIGVEPGPLIEALSSQIGKPFDWSWLLPEMLRRRRWRETSTWYPAELMAWAFEISGPRLFSDHRRKITLEQFWGMVDRPLIPVRREILKQSGVVATEGAKL